MTLHGGSIETKFEDMLNTNSSALTPNWTNFPEQQGHMTKTPKTRNHRNQDRHRGSKPPPKTLSEQ
jgi:hypothetical protein